MPCGEEFVAGQKCWCAHSRLAGKSRKRKPSGNDLTIVISLRAAQSELCWLRCSKHDIAPRVLANFSPLSPRCKPFHFNAHLVSETYCALHQNDKSKHA